jgi:Site-specific DNA methylase
MAGMKVLLAVEFDDNAAEVYRLNFPDTKIYHGDIHSLTEEKILELTGLKPYELDILDGSPPCQGFSTSGKRNINDLRNQLYHEYVRILRILKPKVFVMENVPGMVKGKMKVIFADILKCLKESGYVVSAKVLNAKYFNVPQSRMRMIFIGVREDLNINPSHPKPESYPLSAMNAIQGVEINDCGNPHGKINELMKKCLPGKSLSKSLKISSYFDYQRCPIKGPCMTLKKL